MWSIDYTAETDLAREMVWAALRDWSTGVIPQASGDHRYLRDEFAVGATTASTPEGLGVVLDTRIVAIVPNEEGSRRISYQSAGHGADALCLLLILRGRP